MGGDDEGIEIVDGDVDGGPVLKRKRQSWPASPPPRGCAYLAFEAAADPQSRGYFHADLRVIPFQHLKSAGGAEVTRRIRVICTHYLQPGHETQAYANKIVAEHASGTADEHSETGAENWEDCGTER